jgi:hypothetical protein
LGEDYSPPLDRSAIVFLALRVVAADSTRDSGDGLFQCTHHTKHSLENSVPNVYGRLDGAR